MPSDIDAMGMAATPMTATAATITRTGRRTMPLTTRLARPWSSLAIISARLERAFCEATPSLTRPSSDGSRVSAMSTAMSTVAAATNAMVVSSEMPMMLSDASAMMTVRPAKNTALPAVPTARAAASLASRPWKRIRRRCRLTMNRA